MTLLQATFRNRNPEFNRGLRQSIATLALLLLSGFVSAETANNASAADKNIAPNILFILADDLGWGDVDFHGGPIPTPHLDQLRKESLELTRHYVQPVCTPTRAAFLSGRYCSRFGVSTPSNSRSYPWKTFTLPRALKSVGYETALCGKWHLGSKPEEGPNHFGFDKSYGSLAGGVGPWDHRYKKGPYTHTWHRDENLISEEGHVTDLIAAEAIQWLKNRGEKPFFLYVPFTAIHLPLREPKQYLNMVPDSVTEPVHREYMATIAHLDEAVGKILAALKETGKEKNTLVVFTSDNGGSIVENNDPKYPPDNYPNGKLIGNNLPFRGNKGDIYEGGIREPTLVRWPGHLKPGKFNQPVHISDWMPTFCALAGVQPKENPRWDGINIWPALSGKEKLPSRDIYIVGVHFREAALISGDWKLVATYRRKENTKDPFNKVELYNITKDPSETNDVADTNPEVVERLKKSLLKLSENDRDALANDEPNTK